MSYTIEILDDQPNPQPDPHPNLQHNPQPTPPSSKSRIRQTLSPQEIDKLNNYNCPRAMQLIGESFYAEGDISQHQPKNPQTDPNHPFTQFFTDINIRIKGTVDAPLFVATDVATYINDKNLHRSIKTYHTKYAVKQYHVDISSQTDGVHLFTEKGLYRYLLRSNMPKAEEFQEYVFDVLVNIRRQIVDDAQLEAKIANKTIDRFRHSMSRLNVGMYNDKFLGACPSGLTEYYVAKYLADRYESQPIDVKTTKITREDISLDTFELIYNYAVKHFQGDQQEYNEIVNQILDKEFRNA